jgi:hypothetical protein
MLRFVAATDSPVTSDKALVGISYITDFGLGVDRADDSGSNSSSDVISNSTSDSSSSSDSSNKTSLALPCVLAVFF